MPEEIRVGERLKSFRARAGMDVPELAGASGVSKAYIWQIESGRRKTPSGEMLLRLAEALDVSVSELLGAKEADEGGAPPAKAPKALQAFVRKKGRALGMTPEDVEVLRRIQYRGRRPRNAADWELIYAFLKRILE